MSKEELIEELKSAKEQLKNYNKFINLFKKEDDPNYILAKLCETIGRIQLLLEVNELKELAHPKNKAVQEERGQLVRVSPCSEEYGGKTYLGFLIGNIALGSSITTTEDKIQLNYARHNPAIFVPELRKIIYGIESYWSEIEREEDLKQITSDDIENVWYVKMLKSISDEQL